MAKRGRPRKRIIRRRLIFDNIELLQVDEARHIPMRLRDNKFDVVNLRECWYLPGGDVASTHELVDRAKTRGLTVLLQETVNGQSKTTSLT